MRRYEAALYRLLLLAFPRHVRREFGRDMSLMFIEQLADARRRGDGPIRIWTAAFFDALRFGLAERMTSPKRGAERGVGAPASDEPGGVQGPRRSRKDGGFGWKLFDRTCATH